MFQQECEHSGIHKISRWLHALSLRVGFSETGRSQGRPPTCFTQCQFFRGALPLSYHRKLRALCSSLSTCSSLNRFPTTFSTFPSFSNLPCTSTNVANFTTSLNSSTRKEGTTTLMNPHSSSSSRKIVPFAEAGR